MAPVMALGTNQNPLNFLNQDYEQLKAQCLASNTLFEDETFPADQVSLGNDKLGPHTEEAKGIVWLRPLEIHSSPEFITSGASRFDACQHGLGDCWLVSVMASLTLNKHHLSLVVPEDQSFQTNYAGIFHFKFWKCGEWIDVVVDDRLPTKHGELVFVRSTESNEFWTALLEKAYAKLNGCYDALHGGIPTKALEDFTGGICERYFLKKAPPGLFQIVQTALWANSLLTCCSKHKEGKGEAIGECHVVSGHAYSVTGAQEVSYHNGKVQLIRLRNPWGHTEWEGAWSDNAPEWENIDPKVRAVLNTRCVDGEAWMRFSDFLHEYDSVEICNLCSASVTSGGELQWTIFHFDGNYDSTTDTAWINPQFRIKVEEPDEDEEGAEDASLCTVVVGLTLKDKSLSEDLDLDFDIYSIQDQAQKSTGQALSYRSQHGVSKRFKVPIGEYVVVPRNLNQAEDFCVRVFSATRTGDV
ncbi:calpain-2 catalytic subunit [Xenopus laevis]|uniref:Calpain-2 catalytic subunit n=1 Tax=Xenopus laevis TaxID=8355 RepID=A0A8J0V9J8_XENLA|nr:calpain-2 catalytic subunit [Xenopus laevis]